MGMHAAPAPDLVMLFQAAAICKEFPAYRLEDVRNLRGQALLDVLRAVELLNLVRKLHSPS